jgi:ABC-type dipeptide/oligopeptide/nickel transport system permease component
MASYIVRRFLLMIPTMLGITIVSFGVMALSPGGFKAMIISREGGLDPRARAAIDRYYTKKYALDKPIPVQYFTWLNKISFIGVKDRSEGWPNSSFGFKTPDFGETLDGRHVLDIVEEHLPVTLLLNGITLPLMMGFSLWTGLKAAQHRGGTADVVGGSVFLGLWSVPQIWAGVLLVGYLANKNMLHWFPPAGLHDLRADEWNFLPSFDPTAGFQRGWLLDTCWHLVLPVICLMYAGFAFSSKLTRSATLENMASDFVRTARAKGVGEREILFRHVLRNSLLPLITYTAGAIPGLISGSIIVETVFGIPGMGHLSVDSVFDKDKDLVMSTTLVAGFLGLLSYLVADIAYAIADPRVSYEGSGQ